MPVEISGGTLSGGTTVGGGGGGGDYNDPYEAELAAQKAAGGSGAILGAGFDYTADSGDQPNLATLRAATAQNNAIRQALGTGSVVPTTSGYQNLLQSQLTGIYPNSANLFRNLGLRQNIGTVRPSAASFAPLSFPQGSRMGRPYLGLTTDMMGSSGVRGIGKIPKAPVYDPVTDTYSVDGQPIDRQTAEYMMEVRGDVYDAMPSPSEGMFGKVMDYGLLGKAHEMLLGQTAKERAMGDYGQLLSMGGEIDPETGDVIAPTARGELKYSNTTGLVTYKGAPDPTYEGAYKNLINPYVSDSDSGFVEPEAVSVAAIEPEPEKSMIDMDYRYPAGGYYPREGRFLRRGLLDVAPLTYGGLLRDYTPMSFEEMNVGFRQPTDVSLFQDPYDVSGYTLI